MDTIKRTTPEGDEARESIMAYVKEYWEENLTSPTLKEIMRDCHMSSTSVVKYHLMIMQRQGDIKPMTKARSRQIIPAGLVITIQ